MQQKMFSKINRKEVIKINIIIGLNRKVKLWNQKGQSTLEYALVVVIAGIISAILLAVGKPIIIDTISKVFSKIASMV
jgi:Flp pilus assembly pilin Flp